MKKFFLSFLMIAGVVFGQGHNPSGIGVQVVATNVTLTGAMNANSQAINSAASVTATTNICTVFIQGGITNAVTPVFANIVTNGYAGNVTLNGSFTSTNAISAVSYAGTGATALTNGFASQTYAAALTNGYASQAYAYGLTNGYASQFWVTNRDFATAGLTNGYAGNSTFKGNLICTNQISATNVTANVVNSEAYQFGGISGQTTVVTNLSTLSTNIFYYSGGILTNVTVNP